MVRLVAFSPLHSPFFGKMVSKSARFEAAEVTEPAKRITLIIMVHLACRSRTGLELAHYPEFKTPIIIVPPAENSASKTAQKRKSKIVKFISTLPLRVLIRVL